MLDLLEKGEVLYQRQFLPASNRFGSSVSISEWDSCGTTISNTNIVMTIARTASVSVIIRSLLIRSPASCANLHSPVWLITFLSSRWYFWDLVLEPISAGYRLYKLIEECSNGQCMSRRRTELRLCCVRWGRRRAYEKCCRTCCKRSWLYGTRYHDPADERKDQVTHS